MFVGDGAWRKRNLLETVELKTENFNTLSENYTISKTLYSKQLDMKFQKVFELQHFSMEKLLLLAMELE